MLLTVLLQTRAPRGSPAGAAGGRDVAGVRAGLLLARRLHPVCLPNIDLQHSTQVTSLLSELAPSYKHVLLCADYLTHKTNVETS